MIIACPTGCARRSPQLAATLAPTGAATAASPTLAPNGAAAVAGNAPFAAAKWGGGGTLEQP